MLKVKGDKLYTNPMYVKIINYFTHNLCEIKK